MRFERFEVAMKVQSKREVTGESLNAFVAKSGLKTYHKPTSERCPVPFTRFSVRQ